ncbi:hypothetical protein [Paenibacillus aquistagni]|uniref:hypothetical protein n=1 Tax=Paenibacillus aquistagni TaxID=1852522 RepID=UPI000B511C7E|nr:hypothetical protein [Paenibacillus aquistagni]
MNKIIKTDADLDNCIFFIQPVEIWIGDYLDSRSYLYNFNHISIETREGFFYLREDIEIRAISLIN